MHKPEPCYSSLVNNVVLLGAAIAFCWSRETVCLPLIVSYRVRSAQPWLAVIVCYNTTCTMHLVPMLTFQFVCTWCKTYYVAISAYWHVTVASCLAWVEHSWKFMTGRSWWGSTQREHGIEVYHRVDLGFVYCVPNLLQRTALTDYEPLTVHFRTWSFFFRTQTQCPTILANHTVHALQISVNIRHIKAGDKTCPTILVSDLTYFLTTFQKLHVYLSLHKWLSPWRIMKSSEPAILLLLDCLQA